MAASPAPMAPMAPPAPPGTIPLVEQSFVDLTSTFFALQFLPSILAIFAIFSKLCNHIYQVFRGHTVQICRHQGVNIVFESQAPWRRLSFFKIWSFSAEFHKTQMYSSQKCLAKMMSLLENLPFMAEFFNPHQKLCQGTNDYKIQDLRKPSEDPYFIIIIAATGPRKNGIQLYTYTFKT